MEKVEAVPTRAGVSRGIEDLMGVEDQTKVEVLDEDPTGVEGLMEAADRACDGVLGEAEDPMEAGVLGTPSQ